MRIRIATLPLISAGKVPYTVAPEFDLLQANHAEQYPMLPYTAFAVLYAATGYALRTNH